VLNFGVRFALAIFDLLATAFDSFFLAVGCQLSAISQTFLLLCLFLFWPTAES
jgi:hypothetical protein